MLIEAINNKAFDTNLDVKLLDFEQGSRTFKLDKSSSNLTYVCLDSKHWARQGLEDLSKFGFSKSRP